MANPGSIILFDDAVAAAWQPFTLTRPAGELLFGACTLRERVESVFNAPCAGHIASPGLRGFDEPGAAPVLDPAPARGSCVWLSSRAVPAWRAPFEVPVREALLMSGDDVVGWFSPASAAAPPSWFFASPQQAADRRPDLACIALDCILLVNVWELMTRNSAQLTEDIAHGMGVTSAGLPPHVAGIGASPRLVRLGGRVTFEPGVVVDCTSGPVWLDDDVTVRAFTRLAGPAYVGRGSTLLGGSFSGVSIGPACKVRGEVEASVILGYTNKAHDGFLGHAYVGRWVNMGALTTNSDLKNNYGSVRIWTPSGDRDTGESKIGCLLGDHVKTAIGTLLNTGTVVGAGANLFGERRPPRYVPPFAWGNDGADVHALDRFLATAETVMKRRQLSLTPGLRRVLTAAWHTARDASA